MGTFYTSCRIENPLARGNFATISKVLVDTGSEFTWVPAPVLEKLGIAREKKDYTLITANGQHITRSIGFAIVRIGEYFTVDEVVFAEPGDLLLLGARSLEGMNLAVDPRRKILFQAGPILAAGVKRGARLTRQE
jgi:predicted aspartyl protease